ncbi:Eco57I restriction-modification methylase domain-containing protein [Adlercreutzia sp. ZJ141]|uniref:Eco57I restriction-modification methylase domain-containing protein n=1 Tax=Adlercreutzia sp. ZJ141 TaxID=2709406 RepID=UPI0013EA05D4|nr:Eco57I restriction-modification methylase domain-containing protein [Adlercreutzia sp. ZJ141]
MKKFFGVIGNPPYQEETEGNGRDNPIYPDFMDESYKVAERVELITPARWLFNAGQTKKTWNRKMLEDEYLEVLMYEPDAERIFPTAEIKGGVAVSYRNETKHCEPIGLFVPFAELRDILIKVPVIEGQRVTDVITGAVPYRFSKVLKNDHPGYAELAGKSFDLRTNAFEKLGGKIFFELKPDDSKEYVKIFGLLNNRRVYMWVRRDYLEVPSNFDSYKLMMPKASGNGDYGEPLASMEVGAPNTGHTQTFVSFGNYQSEGEVLALRKYFCTKFARALLGVLKVTQDITPRVWEQVPLQDFTPNSDIDWSKPITEIDQQLYAKYGLSDEEIEFIETHVKEMS